MKPILEVQNLWKQYRIGQQRQRYLSLREQLVVGLKSIARPSKKDTFWALQDLNFEVQEGECLGIIGRNGAGKSTLLKILSKITPPTKGHINVRGRVASLLEVGTGFHQELTGRENIYLNGSILGLKRVEINQKFDEIVEFSGVNQFLETPLKHYSSGMQLRLAFSVAAHLEPEILLIDEVLAVGDTEFQKKCLGKMDEVSKSGRTVLFVSHNLGAVRQLCTRGLFLQEGRVVCLSDVEHALQLYVQQTSSFNTAQLSEYSTPDLQLQAVYITDAADNAKTDFFSRETVRIAMQFWLEKEINNLKIALTVENSMGIEVLTTFHNDREDHAFSKGENSISVDIPPHIFNTGLYFVSLSLSVHRVEQLLECERVVQFKIAFEPENPTMLGANRRQSVIAPLLKWNF